MRKFYKKIIFMFAVLLAILLIASSSFAEIDYSQNNLIMKMQAYWNAKYHTGIFEERGQIKGEENIYSIRTSGQCAGLATIWLYSKLLQTQDLGASVDNYGWFKAAAELIASWDGVRKLTEAENSVFEKFIGMVEYFQEAGQTGKLKNMDTKLVRGLEGKKIMAEFSITAPLNLEQLKKLLKTTNVIQERKLIHISSVGRSGGHATALFKDGKWYYYFDPNSKVGEIKVNSIDEVAQLIFDTNKNWVRADFYQKPVPFSLEIYSFDNGAAEYPRAQDVLSDINPEARVDDHPIVSVRSALNYAVFCGDAASAKYYIESKKAELSEVDEDGNSMLHVAVKMHGLESECVQVLLRLGYKFNKNDQSEVMLRDVIRNPDTPLESKIPRVEMLLKAGCDPNANVDDYPMLYWAIKEYCKNRQNVYPEPVFIEILMKFGADPKVVVGDFSMLRHSMRFGNVEAAKVFMDAGVRLNDHEKGIFGFIRRGWDDSKGLETVLAAGGNPNEVLYGIPAICKTIRIHSSAHLEVLLAAGAKIAVTEEETGYFPLQLIEEIMPSDKCWQKEQLERCRELLIGVGAKI